MHCSAANHHKIWKIFCMRLTKQPKAELQVEQATTAW